MTTVGLPDAYTYTTIRLISCLVASSARAYGSEGSRKSVVVYSTPMTRNRPELPGSGRSRWTINHLVTQQKIRNNRTYPDLCVANPLVAGSSPARPTSAPHQSHRTEQVAFVCAWWRIVSRVAFDLGRRPISPTLRFPGADHLPEGVGRLIWLRRPAVRLAALGTHLAWRESCCRLRRLAGHSAIRSMILSRKTSAWNSTVQTCAVKVTNSMDARTLWHVRSTV
jgi:hypothetical protein